MPKLSKKIAKTVGGSEATHGFGLIDPGKYSARLSEVRAEETRDAKNPMWVLEFDNIKDLEGKSVPGRQWWNLNLPLDENAVPENYQKGADKWAQAQRLSAGRLKAFFEAFGYTEDSDTDEMIGEFAVITIGVRTIQQGPRQGDKANQINDIEPLDEYDLDEDELKSQVTGGGASYDDTTPY